MKCDNCPALRVDGYEYPESYCAAGVPGDGKMATDSGCKYPLAVILKRLERRDRMADSQYDGIGDWWKEERELEDAMQTAIQDKLNHHYGELYLCYRNSDGRYYLYAGDGRVSNDIAATVLHTFREKEAAVQKSFCERCKWKSRKQKCTCCRRNRNMKDNYCKEDADDE